MASIGAAVIGLDHWYSAFWVLDQMLEEEDYRLVAIAERNSEHLEEARRKYSPEVVSTDFRQVLDDERIDVVFSFVPTVDNPEVCLEALGRGKHTLCVKPPAMTVEAANSLAAAADNAGVFFTAYEVQHRLTERSRYLKKILSDGIIGDPISFYHVAHGGLAQPWPGQVGDSWWCHPEKVPGGAWIDHAIYAVDQIRWMFDREVESVSGAIGNRRHKQLQVEDWGLASVRLENGFTAVMEDTWTADSGTHFNRYIGTNGSLLLESDHFMLQNKGTTERLEIPEQTRTPFSIIAGAVQGRERLPFTNTCSVQNLAACLAVYESARTGRRVATSAH